MNTASQAQPVLLMGATGRVSQLLLAHWRSGPPPFPVLTQSRGAGFDLTWSPLVDGPDPLLRFSEAAGGIGTIIAMVGATPSTEGDMSQTAALAEGVLSAAERAGVGRVLLASSSAVYALGEGSLESDTPAPVSPYGRAKLEMEQAVAKSPATVERCCLRIGNVAGADALLGKALGAPEGRTIELDRFPDGKGPLRSYIGPSALARCLEKLATVGERLPPVLNCASQPPVEMADLVSAARLPWRWVPAPAARLATQRITLDCGALAKVIGADNLVATADAMVTELRTLGALA